MPRCAIAALLAALFASAVANAQPAVDRAAMVIGNFAYPGALLDWVRQDADAVAAQLGRAGFRVTQERNVPRRVWFGLLTGFVDSLPPGGIAVFYFAGHAIQYKGRNHLLPIDAQLRRESDVLYEGAELDIIVSRLAEAPSAAKLVIIDASRISPHAMRLRTPPSGLAPIAPPKDVLIAFSAEPGSLAIDDPASGSVFAAALVQALGQPGLTVEEIFRRVKNQVAKETQGSQASWTASALARPLMLVPPRP
jgi:uncharacterized caspase-like protein